MTPFTECQPTLGNYWRSIILFGRNVAYPLDKHEQATQTVLERVHTVVSDSTA